MIKTDRLILRKWEETDAENLYEYAKDPDVGPIAGWPPHQSVEDSLYVIKTVFSREECYCICEKDNNKAIGSIELKLNGDTDMTEQDDECELGYWLGKPYWGKGYMLEAARALLARAFNELNMKTVWCGYYDGNIKSKRVQEKLGFEYHHTCNNVEVPLMQEIRVGHTNYMTKDMFNKLNNKGEIMSEKKELVKDELKDVNGGNSYNVGTVSPEEELGGKIYVNPTDEHIIPNVGLKEDK